MVRKTTMGEIFPSDFRKRRRAILVRIYMQVTFLAGPIGSRPAGMPTAQWLDQIHTSLPDKGSSALCGRVSLRGLANLRRPQAT